MSRMLSGSIAHPELDAPSLTRSQPAALAWASVARALKAWAAAWTERRRVRRAVLQLEALSDRMLADIGLDRSDIARVARYGRDAAEARSLFSSLR
jgi:uncharacterized protein YjiS (DUF1127 family)